MWLILLAKRIEPPEEIVGEFGYTLSAEKVKHALDQAQARHDRMVT